MKSQSTNTAKPWTAFDSQSASVQLQSDSDSKLEFWNRGGKVCIDGALTVTADASGYDIAKELHAIADHVLKELEKRNKAGTLPSGTANEANKITPILGFEPYKDESTSIQLGNLTIENRLDRVEIYGKITLACDQNGYQEMIYLYSLSNTILSALDKCHKAGTLPKEIEIEKTVIKENPFQ